MKNFIKHNYAIGFFALLIATASCSFTNDTVDPGDKDKEELLIQLIGHLLSRYHYAPADLTDQFSKDVFGSYVENLDPGKRYFLQSDYEEFLAYEMDIDDEIKEGRITLFDITYDRLLKRQKEAKAIFEEVIAYDFDLDKKESVITDYEKLPYAKDKKELTDHWRKMMKLSVLSNYYDKIEEQEQQLALDAADRSEAFAEKTKATLLDESVEEVKRSMEESFSLNKDVERMDYFTFYINAITAHFDPHTNYFPPRNKDQFDMSMSGKLEGIGARLQKKMDYISIVEIISGGPAWRSEELEVGDKILKVKQVNDTVATSIVGMRISDAVDLIKGPKGTEVQLTIKKVDGSLEEIVLVRDVVELEETFAKSILVNKEGTTYGMIHLPKFYFDMQDNASRSCAKDVAIELEKLKANNIQGLVFDLRSNGGGSLTEVVKMAGFFVEEGPMVQVGDQKKSTKILRDKDNGEVLYEGPLVIMVNEFSASASEILAAAMQDYQRAVVIGAKQTFGKGTVQGFQDLNNWVRSNELGDLGFVKLTTQKFYRINGGSTQLEGVKSDVVTPTRYSYIDMGERDEDYPMPYDEIAPTDYKKWTGYTSRDRVIQKAQERINKDPLFTLIDESAQWLKASSEEEEMPLDYATYVDRIERLEEQTDKFDQLDEYKSELTFNLLPADKLVVEQDTLLAEKRERWQKSLSKDLYLNEAFNVLKDLQQEVSNMPKAYTLKD